MLPVSSVPEEFDEIKKHKYYNIKYNRTSKNGSTSLKEEN